MLKNLYKTWGQLAPDEAIFWDNEEAVTLQKNHPPCPTWVTTKPWMDGQDALQGYVQRCAEARGWGLEMQHSNRYFSAKIRKTFDGSTFVCEGKNIGFHKRLLIAYLAALAADRQITAGAWRHFKEKTIEVVGVARPVDEGSGAKAIGVYQLENVLGRYVKLLDDQTFETNYWDYKTRVFYSHEDTSWARSVDDFLGLVGAEHPEDEGLLRFVEVADAE